MMTPLSVGDCAERTRSFSPQDLEDYMRLTGDQNPLHTLESGESRFGAPIVHGMLLAGMISALIGSPGRAPFTSVRSFVLSARYSAATLSPPPVGSRRFTRKTGRCACGYRSATRNRSWCFPATRWFCRPEYIENEKKQKELPRQK